MSDPGSRQAIRHTDTFAITKAADGRWVIWHVWYAEEAWHQCVADLCNSEQEAERRAGELLKAKEKT